MDNRRRVRTGVIIGSVVLLSLLAVLAVLAVLITEIQRGGSLPTANYRQPAVSLERCLELGRTAVASIYCPRPAADSGKACTHSRGCQGTCLGSKHVCSPDRPGPACFILHRDRAMDPSDGREFFRNAMPICVHS